MVIELTKEDIEALSNGEWILMDIDGKTIGLMPEGNDLSPKHRTIQAKSVDMMDKSELYNGYRAFFGYDSDDDIYYGQIYKDMGDLVDFIADTKDDVEEQFHKAVDDYLEFCKEIGKDPQKSKIDP